MDAQERSPLILTWQGGRTVLDNRQGRITLGTRPEAGLPVRGPVAGPYTSRNHVTIERRKHSWVLVDHSTNGTYVQTEDEQVAFVRRGEVRLWGDGWISLGCPLAPQSAIRFRHE
jgi:adenylate cyclase